MILREILSYRSLVIYMALAATLLSSQARAEKVRECDVGASQLHTDASFSFSFDPPPELSLRLKSRRGTGFQLGCSVDVTDSGWFVRGFYQQTNADVVVDLSFNEEFATGRFDMKQRVADFDIGRRYELWPDASLMLSVGYSKSWFEPDKFLLVLPFSGAQFFHQRALRENDGGVTATAGLRWQTTQYLGLNIQLRYREKSAYELTKEGLHREVLGRVGVTVKLVESLQFVLESTVGEHSRSSFAGLRWSF